MRLLLSLLFVGVVKHWQCFLCLSYARLINVFTVEATHILVSKVGAMKQDNSCYQYFFSEDCTDNIAYVLSESSAIEQCTQGIVVLCLKHFENSWHPFIETLDPQ